VATTAPLRPLTHPKPQRERHRIASPRGVLIVMLAINLLNYMDRWMLPAVAPKIKHEFGIGDGALGALGAAFTLVYGLTALLVAWRGLPGVRADVAAARR